MELGYARRSVLASRRKDLSAGSQDEQRKPGGGLPARVPFSYAGRVKETCVPSSTRLSILILPPCASTIPFAIARPSPDP